MIEDCKSLSEARLFTKLVPKFLDLIVLMSKTSSPTPADVLIACRMASDTIFGSISMRGIPSFAYYAYTVTTNL